MKNPHLLLAPLALGLITLSACSSETPQNTTSTPPPTLNVASNQTPSPAPVASPSTPAITTTTADQTAYSGAIQLLDPSFCEKITDQTLKTKCSVDITDKKIQEEALAKKDAAICDKVSNDDSKKACQIQIEIGQKQEEKDKINAAEEIKTADLRNEINKVGDSSRCQELIDASQISGCELNILVNEAIGNKSTDICQSATSPETVQICIKDAGELLKMVE